MINLENSKYIIDIDNFGEIDLNDYLTDYFKICALYDFIENEICINSLKSHKKIEVFKEFNNKNNVGVRKRKLDKNFYMNLWINYSNALKRKLITSSLISNYLRKELIKIQKRYNEGKEFTLDEQISIIKLLNRMKNDIVIIKIGKEINNINDNNSLYYSVNNTKHSYCSIKQYDTNNYSSVAKTIYKDHSTNFSDVKNKLDKTLVNTIVTRNINKVLIEKQKTFLKNVNEEKNQKKKKIVRAMTFCDYKMPENVKILYSQKIPTKELFQDNYFPPEISSLMPVDEEGNIILPKDVDMQEISDWEEIKWKRAKEIFNTENFQVFIDEIESNDILQGGIGNCYFLAALASLCELDGQLVSSRFLFHNRSNEGCYGVYFRIAGIWKLVLLDDYFPAIRSYRRYELAFARSNGNELWVLLFEKAWAKICGSYLNTIGGLSYEVFDCITNSFTEKIILDHVSQDLLWEKLIKGQENGFLMSAGSGKEEIDGIVPGHAYSILSVKDIKSHNLRILKLRNPYGELEWTGDWSDSSDKWTNKLREELKVSNEDDGMFWMNLQDFVKHFQIVNICKIHKDYKNYEIHISKKEIDSPIMTELIISEPSHVYIQIHQKYKRFKLKDGSYPEQVIFSLILLDEKFNYVDAVYSKNNIECIEKRLSKGKHYLISDINYRFDQKIKPHGYAISTYSEKKCVLNRNYDNKVEETLKKFFINYTKDTCTPMTTKKFGNEVKFYRKLINKFPGKIFVFENNSDLELMTNLRFSNAYNCGLYNFNSHLITSDQIFQVALKPHSTEVAYIKIISNDYDIIFIEEQINGQSFPIILNK